MSACVLLSSPARASHLRGSRKPDIDLFWELLLFFFAKKRDIRQEFSRIPTFAGETLSKEDIPEWR
ncbi:MAG: hypothetical protein ACPIOQ_42800 [Promethearchaeia archaeon]